MTTSVPPLVLPPRMSQVVEALPEKDQRRLSEVVTRLHAVNARLWDAEDRVRNAQLSPVQVADSKREIDQLNAERNALAERVDEVLALLADSGRADTPLHTETLASVVDRLSVLTLRIWHTEQAASGDELAGRRMPALHRQHEELHTALEALVSDVAAGRRRLPVPARFKLYGHSDAVPAEIRPSQHLKRLIAFGGLSECGKSTSAEFLRRSCGAARLKIGYLLRQAAHRYGIADPYALSARRQAELLLDELNRFADAHLDTELITIESVHDDTSIAELKQLMGEALQVVYLDAPFPLRVARSAAPAQAVASKDEVKTSRGAHRVAALADHLIDNSGSIVSLRARLRLIAEAPATVQVQPCTAHGLALPPVIAGATASFVEAMRGLAPLVRLVALTGSAGEGTWTAGWSDLDLLVVAEQSAACRVGAALKQYRSAVGEHVAIGLTLVTPDELNARRLTPRLAFALHQLQHGKPALHAVPGLRLPAISDNELALAGIQELPQVILTMRRLRAEPTPQMLRQLYKHLVLACRLLLREHGKGDTGPDRILAAAAHIPGMPVFQLPPMADIASAWSSGAGAGLLKPVTDAIDQLLAWYAAQLAAA